MPALCHHFLQALETPKVTGPSRVQRGTVWDSGSSLNLSPALCTGPSPTARVSLHYCLEPRSTVWLPPEPCAAIQSLTCDLSPQLSPIRFPGCLSSDQGHPSPLPGTPAVSSLVTCDQPYFPQGPALHSSLQDSASLLGSQGSVEQFERKFSAKIQTLQENVVAHTQGCPAGPPAL